MALIKKELSGKILTISPDYKNLRGGIGSVISVYSSFFEKFTFVASYKYYKSNWMNILVFFKQLFIIFITLLTNRSIKIVHIHGAHKGSFYRKYMIFLLAKNIFRKKVIYHNHSGCFDAYFKESSNTFKKLITYVVNNSDAVICLSSFWKVFFETNFNPKRLYVVNNVISHPVIRPRNEKSFIQFFFLGRITQQKGIYDLLGVLKKNKDFFENRIKVKIGGNDEIEKLKEIIKSGNLENFVEYIGWIEGEKKNELFNSSDVYILPSYYEGLPISILEAMSYSRPVIATAVGGIPEVIESHVNGILIQPGDLEVIEASMMFFINNPGKIDEYGHASYKKITPFLPEQVAAQLQDIYETLLRKQKDSIPSKAVFRYLDAKP